MRINLQERCSREKRRGFKMCVCVLNAQKNKLIAANLERLVNVTFNPWQAYDGQAVLVMTSPARPILATTVSQSSRPNRD